MLKTVAMDDTPYDAIAYPARAFLQCHPDRLATVARLFGIAPVPVTRARILELGCGEGFNLMGAAATLPEAEFVGVDLSRNAIERGRAIAAEAALSNVRLEHCDLCTAGSQFGSFDYVIAHGLYSWVPEAVRDAMLELIKRIMTPAGIALISYNAYPGWYMRRMVREMITGLGEIQRALEWLETMRGNVSGSAAFNAVIRDEANEMLSRSAGCFYHDDLAVVNHPMWFREFAGHAARYGLQYVAEADIGTTGTAGLQREACEAVDRFAGGNRIEREQYADFLRGRRFRQTLLCHAGLTVRDTPDPAATGDLYLGAPVTRHPPDPAGRFEYRSVLGGTVTSGDASIQTVLDAGAGHWPCFIPVRCLPKEIGAQSIVDLFASLLIELRTVPPPVCRAIPDRPRSSSFARVRARLGPSVTSLHHIEVTLNNGSLRSLLTLLDGTRTRRELIEELAAYYPAAPKEKVSLAVDTHLAELCRSGLLAGSGPASDVQ